MEGQGSVSSQNRVMHFSGYSGCDSGVFTDGRNVPVVTPALQIVSCRSSSGGKEHTGLMEKLIRGQSSHPNLMTLPMFPTYIAPYLSFTAPPPTTTTVLMSLF